MTINPKHTIIVIGRLPEAPTIPFGPCFCRVDSASGFLGSVLRSSGLGRRGFSDRTIRIFRRSNRSARCQASLSHAGFWTRCLLGKQHPLVQRNPDTGSLQAVIASTVSFRATPKWKNGSRTQLVPVRPGLLC